MDAKTKDGAGSPDMIPVRGNGNRGGRPALAADGMKRARNFFSLLVRFLQYREIRAARVLHAVTSRSGSIRRSRRHLGCAAARRIRWWFRFGLRPSL